MSYLNIDKIPESDFEFEQQYAALMIPHYKRNRFLELIKKGYAPYVALRIMEQQDQISGRTGEGKKTKKIALQYNMKKSNPWLELVKQIKAMPEHKGKPLKEILIIAKKHYKK